MFSSISTWVAQSQQSHRSKRKCILLFVTSNKVIKVVAIFIIANFQQKKYPMCTSGRIVVSNILIYCISYREGRRIVFVSFSGQSNQEPRSFELEDVIRVLR